MDYKIETTNSFEKDIKRLQKRGWNMLKIKTVLEKLAKGKALSEKHKNHKLRNTNEVMWDCHIEPDWVLLYSYSIDNQTIYLIRTGSHSDLFG